MISCVYCGGNHPTAAQVRECWHTSTQSATQTGTQTGDASATRSPVTETGGGASDGPPSSTHIPRGESRRPRGSATGADGHAQADQRRGPVRPKPPDIDQRGPAELGRNAIVSPGADDPSGWEGVERVPVGPEQLAAPETTVTKLRGARTGGESLIIEIDPALTGRFGALHPPAETTSAAIHELDPAFTFWLDELHALVFANAFDARDAEPSTTAPDYWVDYGPTRVRAPIDGVPVVPSLSYALVDGSAGAPDVNDLIPFGNTTDAALAADQLAAVTHNGGSARIIAPAGSGKTRVLTERARHLLGQWRLPPSSVCLVAFNKRAQEEMRERTADLPGLQVRTLNSIALAIINGRTPFAPQPRQWRTIDEPDVRRILDNFVKSQRRLNIDPMATWIDALSSVRLGMRDPDEVEGDYGGDVSGLGHVYDQYVRALDAAGSVDFDHQIVRAIEVLLTQPDARAQAQAACRVLLVDEFQDLTPAHLLMIRLLAGPLGSVFGVGDDDQTIYGYNGADPAWLIDFSAWFPGAGDHPLEVNYRCPAGVVEAADRLLRHNRHRVAKAIRARNGAPAGGWTTDASADPVRATTRAVSDALDGGVEANDIAVLTRVNTTLAPVQVSLRIAGISISGGVGGDYAERTAVRAAFAWLRLAEADSLSARDLSEALRRPSRGLHPRVRDWASEQSDIAGLRRLSDRLTAEKDSRSVSEFADDLERLRGMYRRQVGTAELLRYLIDDIGLGVAVSTLDGGRRGTNRSAQNDDLQAFRQIADLYDQHGDGPFEGWLRGHLMAPRAADGVVLSTVHRVKGQEWPHVVVHLADEDQYPHRLAESVEEERRLFHVALTRASAQATIVAGVRPSPFIDELTTEPDLAAMERDATIERERARANTVRPSSRSNDTDRDVHPLADRSTVLAVVGLTLVDQGQEWLITAIEPGAAVATRGALERRFNLGEKVETLGRQRGALAPRPGATSEASVLAFDALRVFRDAARAGKPAYTVFDDKTLAGIAEALPVDLTELAQVRGVGPAKLDTYGDDVIDIIDIATGRGR